MEQFTPLILLGVMVLFFYGMVIRPQRRQREQLRRLADSLVRGDEVMTRDGIYGTVTRVGDKDVELEVSPGVAVRFHKAAVVQRETPEEIEDEEEQERPEEPA
ncbi:MAG: preprotein translocase subunit YajC [Actinomycetota bacterium]